MLAPVARSALLTSVLEPLAALALGDDLEEATEAALETVLLYGDLIELRPDLGMSEMIRPAPPAFIRHGACTLLIGVAGEHASPLPAELTSRIDHRGPVRQITASAEDDLPATLTILGLQELAIAAWLRAPAPESAGAFLTRWRQRLEAAGRPSEDLTQLEVLGRGNSRYYATRWETPGAGTNGVLITRRRHAYGGRIWALADFSAGRPRRLLDLDADGRHQRACDVAWRLSAALDAEAGRPQGVRLETSGAETRLLFDAPAPSFAERRLSLLCRREASTRALFSFVAPTELVVAEIPMLRELLWLDVATASETPQ